MVNPITAIEAGWSKDLNQVARKRANSESSPQTLCADYVWCVGTAAADHALWCWG